VDDRLHRNKAVIDWASKLKIGALITRLGRTDLAQLRDAGCELLVVASYSWRIPDWSAYLKYAINFHPSPLPEGRGPDPTVRALLEERRLWAVTCHKIVHDFDAGDILDNEPFALASDDCRDVLDMKIQMAASRLAARVSGDFAASWANAAPQARGSYWPLWTSAERTLNFSESVARNLRRVRAFGAIECLAIVNKTTLYVKRVVGWTEPHQYAPGTVVYENSLRFLVAVSDGYIAIVEWSLLAPGATTGKTER
jgi:methionyl-tRNA formyltransferase